MKLELVRFSEMSVTLYQMSVTLYQMSVTLYQMSVTLYQMSVTLYQMSVTLYQMSVNLLLRERRPTSDIQTVSTQRQYSASSVLASSYLHELDRRLFGLHIDLEPRKAENLYSSPNNNRLFNLKS
jgi:hypothetical protein